MALHLRDRGSNKDITPSLRDFFDWDLYGFALVRVVKTKALLPSAGDFLTGRQQADLEVLQWAYQQPDEAQTPESITLRQNRLGGCTLSEQTNLLRQGGVYLLPLSQHEGEFYLMGDLDVLFEVDDQGLIFSHSDFEEFAAYDNQPWETLMEAVRGIVENDPLLPDYAALARVLREGMPLAVITVLDSGKPDAEGFYISQQAQAEEIVLEGTQSVAIWRKNSVTRDFLRLLKYLANSLARIW